jgi:hypothetical protein
VVGHPTPDDAWKSGDEEARLQIVDSHIIKRAPIGDCTRRQLVDLDFVGDPGATLTDNLGEPASQMLFGWAWDDDANAAMLAEEYLRTIREEGYPVPSGFDEDAESIDGGWSRGRYSLPPQ